VSARDEFLAGKRPKEVALFLADDQVDDPEQLAELGTAERVSGGTVLVIPGDRGRAVVSQAVGRDVMEFAQEAGAERTSVDRDLTGGECPADDDAADHQAAFIFAFVEPENEEVGDLYAEGPVVHAYVACSCGTAYSERWVAET
jgi:hypothetical protein